MLPLDQQHSLASVPWKTTLCHTHWTPSPWVAHTWVLCCGIHRQLLTPTVDILVTSALWTPAAQKFLSFFFKFSRSSEIKTRQHWFSMFFSWIAIMITMQRNSYLWEEFNKIHLKHILKLSFCFFETMLIRFSNASILGLSWEVKISMLNIPLYFVANLFNVCN